MKILEKMKRRTAIWIVGVFKTSPTESIKAIARIIPIKFHLQKFIRRFQIQPLVLPTNHLIRSFMDDLTRLRNPCPILLIHSQTDKGISPKTI